MSTYPMRSQRKLTHEKLLDGSTVWEPCCTNDIRRAIGDRGLNRTLQGETVKSGWGHEYRLRPSETTTEEKP